MHEQLYETPLFCEKLQNFTEIGLLSYGEKNDY